MASAGTISMSVPPRLMLWSFEEPVQRDEQQHQPLFRGINGPLVFSCHITVRHLPESDCNIMATASLPSSRLRERSRCSMARNLHSTCCSAVASAFTRLVSERFRVEMLEVDAPAPKKSHK